MAMALVHIEVIPYSHAASFGGVYKLVVKHCNVPQPRSGRIFCNIGICSCQLDEERAGDANNILLKMRARKTWKVQFRALEVRSREQN